MYRIAKLVPLMLVVLPSVSMVGCGGTPGKARLEVAELGLSMELPSGWTVDRLNPRMFTRGNNIGLVLDEPLAGQTFGEYVEAASLGIFERAEVISRNALTISGYEAIETIIEYPDAGSKAIKMWVQKGDRVIEVSVVTPIGDFSRYETSLRTAFQSIEIG